MAHERMLVKEGYGGGNELRCGCLGDDSSDLGGLGLCTSMLVCVVGRPCLQEMQLHL